MTETSDSLTDAAVDPAEDERTVEVPDAAEADVATPYPDPNFIHKQDSPELVKATDSYLMDEPTQYRTADKLPVLDVRSLSAAGGRLWAGTAEGLYAYDEQKDLFEFLDSGTGTVLAVMDISRNVDSLGRVAVLTEGELLLFDSATGDATLLFAPAGVFMFVSVELTGETLWMGAIGGGLWMTDLTEDDPLPAPIGNEAFTVVDLATDSQGLVWMATPGGLRSWDPESKEMQFFTADAGELPDDDVRAVVVEPGTNVVFAGTREGIARIEGGQAHTLTAGVGLMPYDDVLSLASGSERLLLGQSKGATALEDPLTGGKPFKRFDHFTSGRWIPDNLVQATAVDDEGRVWLGTPLGVSKIEWIQRTFAKKAAYMETLQEERFWRMDGFVPSDAHLDDEWEPTESWVGDKDNDGLWTQMQIGAWCYAYSVTGDEMYYEKARKALDVMMLQIDIPAVDFEAAGLGYGFVTRSLVRDDEGNVYESKATQDNWHPVHYDGRDYYWKDDTSSDEVDGHFYGYPLFYDLCAKTDEERQEIADHAAALARYIIEGGYVLIDLDGEKTFHGHWSPETIGAAAEGIDACLANAALEEDFGKRFKMVESCYESYMGGGWLNSTEILGTLLAAYHMTGDQFFYDEYEKLVTEYNYENLVMPHEETVTITKPAMMNHSDHELAMLAYHTLIRYEPNDDRRQKWVDGLLYMYEWEKVERNPLWAAFVALLAGFEHTEMEAALRSLREMPFDRREWLVDNSHRKDAKDWPDDRHGDPQFEAVFAYDEIKTIWWNSNFHVKKGGGNPKELSGPMAWLLPYWALRYAGVIGQ